MLWQLFLYQPLSQKMAKSLIFLVSPAKAAKLSFPAAAFRASPPQGSCLKASALLLVQFKPLSRHLRAALTLPLPAFDPKNGKNALSFKSGWPGLISKSSLQGPPIFRQLAKLLAVLLLKFQQLNRPPLEVLALALPAGCAKISPNYPIF